MKIGCATCCHGDNVAGAGWRTLPCYTECDTGCGVVDCVRRYVCGYREPCPDCGGTGLTDLGAELAEARRWLR
jgi:hypothetical protein